MIYRCATGTRNQANSWKTYRLMVTVGYYNGRNICNKYTAIRTNNLSNVRYEISLYLYKTKRVSCTYLHYFITFVNKSETFEDERIAF